MLVYQGTKKSFSDDVENDDIAQKINDRFIERLGHGTSKNEFNAWINSMEYMYKVLNDQEIPSDCGVAIEYSIPPTAKRVDFILSGYNSAGIGQADIIELKQWSSLTPIFNQDGLVEPKVKTYTGGALRPVAHPSYQAWSYAQTIQDYNETVQNEHIDLHPCTYLHNYISNENDPLRNSWYSTYLAKAPAFTSGEVHKLRDFLKENITSGDNQDILTKIDSGKIKPSKSLQDSLAKMLKGNPEFILIDDQKVVFEDALLQARRSCVDGKKRVMIVEGGPGTGKSVVAINLLVKMNGEGHLAHYVTKNSAPRNVYRYELRGSFTGKCIDSLFLGSGSFVDTPSDSIDVLIVDEAHRLNEKSGLYANQGINQIKEIINAAKCSIFFIDESQRVTLQDIGSVAEIEHWAYDAGAEITHGKLESQFRCHGSDGYLAWLDDTLQIRETANWSLEDIDYDFIVVDSPEEIERMTRAKNTRNKARILAGYCWEWPTGSTRDDSDYHEITIGDWGISWNLHDTSTFAIDRDSINQAGCIHTAQGLEFDYAGVIIGDDLRYEDGRVITDYSKHPSSDRALRGIKKIAASNPRRAQDLSDELIKNTYRTLMTRGMKGCYVYCTDKALGDYLKRKAKEGFIYADVTI